jgi:alkyldihydroxyacetonephosphate synthase
MLSDNWVEELKGYIGHQYVTDKQEALLSHSFDYWPVAIKWKQQGKIPFTPQAIVRPINTDQVSRLLKWANHHKIPITPWGAGSGVTGAALPVQGGILLDMSTMNRTLILNEANLLVTVQAGKLGGALEKDLNLLGYTLNHSPQSLDRSTVGGWVATKATGQFSSRWGSIEDLAVSFNVVLSDGEVVEVGLIPRAAMGPDLRHIFLGSEGTLGVITEVTMKIFPLPDFRLFEALSFESIETGLKSIQAMLRVGLRPFLVRFYDKDESRFVLHQSDNAICVLFLGFEGIRNVTQAEYDSAVEICKSFGGVCLGPDPVLAWMDRRFDFSMIEKQLDQPGGLAETIEIAHSWDAIYETYTSLKEVLSSYVDEVLCHFSHVYPQGSSLYVILLGKVGSNLEAEERLLEIWDITMKTCLEKGAILSHHHGIGLARNPYLHAGLGSETILLKKLKAALDPSGILNPGKLGDGNS